MVRIILDQIPSLKVLQRRIFMRFLKRNGFDQLLLLLLDVWL